MSDGLDPELLNDFIIEAGELLESLNSQLISLEEHPTDKELLNSIFRGFHTIKGGAGFLNVKSLVSLCHECENIFDLLRNNKITFNSNKMDVILKAFDEINAVFTKLKAKQDFNQYDESIIPILKTLAKDEPVAAKQEEIATPEKSDIIETAPTKVEHLNEDTDTANADITTPDQIISAISENSNELITDDEFDKLLDALDQKKYMVTAGSETNENSAKQETPSHGAVSAPTLNNTNNASNADPKQNSNSETTLRVDTELLDKIMNMVGELVLIRNRLNKISELKDYVNLNTSIKNLDLITTDLQNNLMKTRMQPIKKVFSKFPRVVRDLAKTLGKEIELTMEGEDTELDKNLIEALADPLVHLVRNSVDHGIESIETRKTRNKNIKGNITLKAKHAGDHILIEIVDDGNGMDAELLKSIAVKRGLHTPGSAAALTEQEAFNLIFAPGFSTKTEITDISGRGVGMDVVKTNITNVGGIVLIESALGKGTTITINVPLTLAILSTIMVKSANNIYAIPINAVREIIDHKSAHIKHIEGKEVLVLRQKTYPLYKLETLLKIKNVKLLMPIEDDVNNMHKDESLILIIHNGDNFGAFMIDALLGQEDVVIKSLDSSIKGTKGITGATITGDGKVAFILDILKLAAS